MTILTEEQSAFLYRCGVDPAHLDLDVMARLFDDLVQANQRMNLTRITSSEEFWNLHILDSLSVGIALPEIMAASFRVADVGCGAGFPLLPLAWANPRLDVTGIESRGKKVEFVKNEAATLGLNHVHVIQAQAREAGRLAEFAGQFDVVLLRAVGTAGKMLRECRNLLKPIPESKIIFYKTPAAVEAERPDAQREAGKYHLQLIERPAFHLPADAGERQFLLFNYMEQNSL
jgi:16S rRNA (guanine527-N7)-methyltransferase